jgi:hypothetical protein
LGENCLTKPHPGPLLPGEGDKKFPFSFQEKGLGDEVNKAIIANWHFLGVFAQTLIILDVLNKFLINRLIVN